jgi:UPF0755 protein
MKLTLRILIVVASLLMVGVFASAGYALFQNKSPEDWPEESWTFTVERGESVQRIARRLEEEGVIRSPLLLRGLSKMKATQTSFQSGTYLIPVGSSSLQVHDILVSGQEILQKVTVPEGWTVSRVADELDANQIVKKADFVGATQDPVLLATLGIRGDSAEGYLFPDTYLFPKGYPAEKVLQLMVERFFEVVADIDSDFGLMGADQLHEMVILASVIEREYVVEDEASLMASVFYNRLVLDMKLQSCATVAYALSEEMGQEHPDSLTLRDLEVESLYNTYLHEGLPPGPIANPGATALRSVFFPAETDFLFFLLKDPASGAHEFTVNYDEHLYAKNLYLKKR